MHFVLPKAKTVEVVCKYCGKVFTARVADRKRGWAQFCSKPCKAIMQEAQTGQYAALKRSSNERERELEQHDACTDCHPFSEDAFRE